MDKQLPPVEGTIERGFDAIRDGFAEGQQEDEGGAQLCIYRNGKKVVDLATGRDTMGGGAPYRRETLTIIMSCTKGLTATVAHRLIETERLDPEARVTRYWPEFGQAGKENVLVRHLMSHTAGLSGFDPKLEIGARELLDFARCADALARMEPLWTPGTASAYHAITYGYLVGEVIRRVTGKSVGTLFREEIAVPLGLDLWIGLPANEEPRIARQFTRRPDATVEQMQALYVALGIDPENRMAKAVLDGVAKTPEAMRVLDSPEGRAAEIPAGNGVGNARSLARLYAATIGEVDGVRLLKSETVARARVPKNEGLLPPAPFSKFLPFHPPLFGLGYELARREVVPMLGKGSFGHAGAGGRIGFAHPESGIAVAYLCNNMSWDPASGPDPRWMSWLNALTEVSRR
jgi:CubicO group peptidase (beta-lactamase class C family)